MKKFFSHPLLIVSVILFADQVSKFWVKLHMYLGEEIHVLGNWFLIHFTENNGMAFGLEFGDDWGKLVLSVFRILAIFALSWYIIHIGKQHAPKGVLVCMSMILAGAIGNVIDSLFYGMIFSDSYGSLATVFPEEGGYAPFLFGKVVDMLYFPLLEGFLPNWIPIWGGDYFIFFRPVFNIADSSITVGVLSLILFFRKYFKEEKPEKQVTKDLSEDMLADQ
ncbi:MAG: lipoprotein signal peptidase [Vicingaceae bacterium]